ncbi:MAG: TIGR03842 family LLM class F420-dependent oxidoreductase [Acidobacteriota bacterium]|nr:TIGR03842 family LLM class F420-dependent oxidoreductase [Blastocatellia bacterium]MDW8240754.1 TIGR03842 family LLM class F420-dependent oxidoreductase [Acidobacteriota bacterium]
MLEFAITFKPDMEPERIVNLTKQAEALGFSYGWVFDSHILWQEPYPLLTLMAMHTRQMRLGPCVTNPIVRDPTVTASLLATLNRISGGRMDLGIGRGDSSRRVMGKSPATLARMERAIQVIRDLNARKQIIYDDQPIQMTWADTAVPPVWVAGYGPKVLRCAGRVADGVILQFADPALIQWCLGFVRQGAEEAGRDPATLRVMSATAVWVSDDLAAAREPVRWFPALVSNHVVDLISRYSPDELPEALTSYVRHRQGYDYLHHCEVGSSNANFVPDEIVDRFCIVGPVETHIQRLRELQQLGVTQFNIYLMCGEEERTLEVYGRDIIPAFR